MTTIRRINNEIIKNYNINSLENLFKYNIFWQSDLSCNSNSNSNSNSNIIGNLKVELCNKYIFNIEIDCFYPFNPPNVNIIDKYRREKDFLRWANEVTSVVNNRSYLTSENIQIASLFSLLFFSSSPFKKIERKFILEDFPIKCLCCSSIICKNNWTAICKIDDIIKEYCFYKNLLFYTSPSGQKIINNLFYNFNNITIPLDIIVYIFSFI